MMRSIFLLTVLTTSLCCFRAQGQSDFIPLEERMIECVDGMRSTDSDEVRRQYSDSLRMVIIEALNSEGCLGHPFEIAQNISILTNKDQTVKLFNWNLPFNDQTHKYFGFILWLEDEKKGITNWVELTDNVEDFASVENKYLTPEKWQGALYYDLIEVKKSRKKGQYILLGWDGLDALTSRKIIEVITMQKGKVRLGAPIFDYPKRRPKRFAIDYSEEVMVSLKYHSKDMRIVFDHVAPRAPGLEGNPAFYGPDLTFDCFQYDKGKWVYEADIDITLNKDQSKRPYNDPRNR